MWRGCLYVAAAILAGARSQLINPDFNMRTCGKDEMCVGSTCRGTRTTPVTLNPTNGSILSVCAPKYPEDTFVGMGNQFATSNQSLIDMFLRSKPGNVESVHLRATNLFFSVPIIVRSEKDLALAIPNKQIIQYVSEASAPAAVPYGTGNHNDPPATMNRPTVATQKITKQLPDNFLMYPQNYSSPILEQRLALNTYDIPRCNLEVCLPEICTFLDLNMAGEPLLLHTPKDVGKMGDLTRYQCNASDNPTNSGELLTNDSNPELVVQAFSMGCISSEPRNNYSLNVVNMETYCNPLFGTRVKVGKSKGLHPPYEQQYEKDFPTKKPVTTVFNRYLHSGVLVPVRAGAFYPDHYYAEGAAGRFGDAELKMQASSCQSRLLPRYMFANICAFHYGLFSLADYKDGTPDYQYGHNCIGTKRKPTPSVTHVSNTDQYSQDKDKSMNNKHETDSKYSNVFFTLNDPLIMIGPFAGIARDLFGSTSTGSYKKFMKYGVFQPFVINKNHNGKKPGLPFADSNIITSIPMFYYTNDKSPPDLVTKHADYDDKVIDNENRYSSCKNADGAGYDKLVKYGYGDLPPGIAAFLSNHGLTTIPHDRREWSPKSEQKGIPNCLEKRLTKLNAHWEWRLLYSSTYQRYRQEAYETNAWATSESLANSLVLNQMWSQSQTTLGGYLNDWNAWSTINDTQSVYNFPFKISEDVDKALKGQVFSGQCSTLTHDLKQCREDALSCDCLSSWYQLDYTPRNHPYTDFRQYQKFFELKVQHGNDVLNLDKIRQPLQTVQPVGGNFTFTPSNVPPYLRGSSFSTFVTAQFSSSQMVDRVGPNITYYHPMFRPLVFSAVENSSPTYNMEELTYDEGCYYEHTPTTSSLGNNVSQLKSNYQGTKGYCYCPRDDNTGVTHKEPFAVGIVSLIRAFHMRVKLFDEACRRQTNRTECTPGSEPTFCSNTSAATCDVPELTRQIACRFHTPFIVSEQLNNRDVHIDPNTGAFTAPAAEVNSDALCDLQVCDVAMKGDHSYGDYVCAEQHAAKLRTALWRNIDIFVPGDQPDAMYASHGWSNLNGDAMKEYMHGNHWFNTGTVFARDYARADDGRYCYKDNGNFLGSGGMCEADPNWMLIQIEEGKKKDAPMVNYYDAILYDVDNVVKFPSSTMDAGFINDKSTRESISCDCDDQPIELMCSGEVPAGIEANLTIGNMSRLDLVACAYSFKYSASGPPIGLFLPSTRRNVRIIERNLLHFDGNDSLKVRYDEIQQVVLGKETPKAGFAESKLIYSDDHLKDPPPFTEVYATTFDYSCMRYPYGRLHRSQMSPNARAEIYPENTTTIKHESLVGYCEFVHTADGVPRLRHCPNARQTARERLDFCTSDDTSYMATHIIYGFHVTDMDRSTACSDALKICLIVPGSPDTAGDIKAYTSGKVAGLGYTLLVAPFNASLLSRYMLYPMAMPTVASRQSPFVMPNYSNPELLAPVNNARMLKTFGYDPSEIEPMLELASSVDDYLKDKNITTTEHAETEIASVVTNFVNKLKEFGQTSSCPGDMPFVVPELGSITLKECAGEEEILGPIDEIMIPVEHDGMRIVSALQEEGQTVFPIRFAGVPPRAPSCERFLVGGSQITLHAEFDQTECLKLEFDNYHLVPVKLVGVKLNQTEVFINTSATALPISLAVLGSDAEVFNVPTILKVRDLKASVISNDESSFDLAFARVSPLGTEAEVTVECLSAQNGSVAPSNCRVLMMGIKDDELPIFYRTVPDGIQNWNPFADKVKGRCGYGPPESILKADFCRVTDVSDYTGLFGYGYEQIAFDRNKMHHVPIMNCVSVIMAILLAGLLCINVALWMHDDSRVRRTAGLQPHKVSFADLTHVPGIKCKGTKVLVGKEEYTMPELEKAMHADPSSFPFELQEAFD